jgi:hypothetical protein
VEAAEGAGGSAKPHEGRGFVIGVGLGAGGIDFANEERLALYVGAKTTAEGGCSFGTCFFTQVRSARVAPRGTVVPGAEQVVSFPASQSVGSFSFVAGWSFSPRVAALLDAELAARWEGDGFGQVLGGIVVRYSPVGRLWVEAGPSFGDLQYVFNSDSLGQFHENEAARVHGEGVLAAMGYELVRKRTWRVDGQLRVSAMWYDELRTTSLSLQLGIHRRRS